jgi:hypothetical protein
MRDRSPDCASNERSAERELIAAYAERRCAAVQALVEARRVSAEEAALLQDRLRAFAGDIRAGLHLEEGERG